MTTAEKYLDFMVCVLQADGIIHEKEVEEFTRMLQQVGLKPELKKKYRRVLKGTWLDAERVIRRVAKNANPQFLNWLVRDGYLMADADGKVTPPEIEIINELLIKAGVSTHRRQSIHDWGKQAVKHARAGAKLFSKSR